MSKRSNPKNPEVAVACKKINLHEKHHKNMIPTSYISRERKE